LGKAILYFRNFIGALLVKTAIRRLAFFGGGTDGYAEACAGKKKPFAHGESAFFGRLYGAAKASAYNRWEKTAIKDCQYF